MKRVLAGCGIVLALGLVGVIVSSVVMYSWWKDNAPDTDRLHAAQEELRAEYGHPDEYLPPLDGGLDADRIAAYVRVREALVAPRDSIAVPVGAFIEVAAQAETDGQGVMGGIKNGLGFAKQGVRLLADGVAFISIRAETLYGEGMGEGEFAYLDALALHGWLGWDPLRVAEDDPVAESNDVMDGLEEALDQQRDDMIERLRKTRRALDSLETPSGDESAFRARIEAELEATRANRTDFPFEHDMPEAWAAMLEPHRTRIERTLPSNVAEILLEAADHMLDEESGDGVNFRFESH